MDREAWHAAIHGVAKSRTRLSDWTELNWTEHVFIKIWSRMMVIPLTRNAYHCLYGCLVFDSKFKSFKGDLKLVLAFFSSVHYSFWYILWLVIFSALEAYWPLNHFCVNKSPFIMSFWLWILLRDTSFLVADPKSSAFISLWPDWPHWRKVWKASWVSFFLMIREKKCLSSSLFSGFCEVMRKVQPHVQAGF